MPQGISLLDRPERSYRPKARHFAVVDAILYPPKVSSERVVDDVGTDGNNRRNGSKVPYLWLTCLNGYKGTTSTKGVVRLCPIIVFFLQRTTADFLGLPFLFMQHLVRISPLSSAAKTFHFLLFFPRTQDDVTDWRGIEGLLVLQFRRKVNAVVLADVADGIRW